MAGFFSLGSATNTNTNSTSDPNTRTSSSSWLLYGTTTRNIHDQRHTTTKDFDFWQQPSASNLLEQPSRASMGGGDHGDGRFINFSDDPSWGSSAVMMMGHGGGGVSCRDCGNTAKKDCPHLRCRTCCKSRGFQCQTHVKSTWVPATKRRERQQNMSVTQQDHNRRRLLPTTEKTRSVQDPENPKFANPLAAASTVGYNSSSEMEAGNFPSEVTTQADFRCIRVSSIDEAADQFAYQAVVNIRGHSFKGILYDQGPEGQFMGGDNTSSGGSGGIPQLNLSSISPGNSTAGANFIGQSLLASLGGNDYLTSTQFFHQISRD